jgi:altronate dehydratase large subunit
MSSAAAFEGYYRSDGSVGIRNLVAVVAVMDVVNPIVRRVAGQVEGTVAITCDGYGRTFGRDREQQRRTLAGLASNPNISSAIVVSMEASYAKDVADRIAATGRPVEVFAVFDSGGTAKTAAKVLDAAQRFCQAASGEARKPAPLSVLTMGVECGATDTTSGVASNPAVGYAADVVVNADGTVLLSETAEFTGAEHILARRASDETVANRIIEIVQNRLELALTQGVDITKHNPGADNIAGGLTTLEEKSLGAIKKGGTGIIQEVIDYALRPSRKGLIIIDAPSPGVENVTGLGASGAQLICFSTGWGHPIGNPVSPTIKISGNPRTVEERGDNIDVDVSGVIRGTQSIEEAGRQVMDEVIAVANGKLTKAEELGDLELSISRLNVSF